MKDFFKYTAATVVGIIVFTIVCVALSVMSIVGMVASASATQAVEKNSVLVLKLNGSIDEQGTDNTIGKLTGNYIPSTGLNDILSAIKKAKDEENIKVFTSMLEYCQLTMPHCRRYAPHLRIFASRARKSLPTQTLTRKGRTIWRL